MTALPDVRLADQVAPDAAKSSVLRQTIVRVWWVACLLPALVLLAVAAGR